MIVGYMAVAVGLQQGYQAKEALNKCNLGGCEELTRVYGPKKAVFPIRACPGRCFRPLFRFFRNHGRIHS
jgi:hypothetical protein